MAERERSVLAHQSLRQRLGDRVAVEGAVTAWTARRNTTISAIDWRLTTDAARNSIMAIQLVQVAGWAAYRIYMCHRRRP